MKKLALVFTALSLTACGPTMKSVDMKEIELSRADKHKECVAARAEAEARRMEAMKALTPEQMTMAFFADAMTRQAEALSGKGDPCSQGMNAFEMETAVAKSRNEVINSLGGTVVRAAGAVGIGVVVGDVVKTLSKQKGDQITADNGSSVNLEKTTSNSETNVKTGDESSGDVSVPGPTTSGTDKSQHETIHEAAPAATPAAEEPAAEGGEE